jgi:hypothetical protein
MYALDRESIANDILLGYAEVAQGTQPVISYAYVPDQITTVYNFDPEKAKALLAEAGFADVRVEERRFEARFGPTAAGIVGGQLWVATERGRLYVVDAASGAVTHRFVELDFPLHPYSRTQRPVTIGGRVIVPFGMFVLAVEEVASFPESPYVFALAAAPDGAGIAGKKPQAARARLDPVGRRRPGSDPGPVPRWP